MVFSHLPSTTMPLNLNSFEFEVLSVERRGIIRQRETKVAQYLTEDLGNSVNLEMVAIPGGNFLMGARPGEEDSSNNERPQHRVTVQSFFLGKFPVTQAQWKAVSEAAPNAHANFPKINRDLNFNSSIFPGDNRPVEKVSWYDALEFCARLSKKTGRQYRLPSEAEWEYACRAGTINPFHFGETITSDLANYNGNYTYACESKGEYRAQTTDVGSFPPNGFGLYDLHGNVWEWCADTWHYHYQGAPSNGSAWISSGDESANYSPLRGGSWVSHPDLCRSAFRTFFLRSQCHHLYHGVGFRVLCAPNWT